METYQNVVKKCLSFDGNFATARVELVSDSPCVYHSHRTSDPKLEDVKNVSQHIHAG